MDPKRRGTPAYNRSYDSEYQRPRNFQQMNPYNQDQVNLCDVEKTLWRLYTHSSFILVLLYMFVNFLSILCISQIQMVPYQPQIQYVQPVQPQFIRQTVQPSSSSIRTVSDIESFMENQRINQLPAFKPYTYGATQNSAPIFCTNKDEWNFLVKAIVHRREVEESFKKLDEL